MEQPDQALIEAAREAIAAGEVTAAGLPTVESLEKRLGRNVTARERDEAVNSLESGVRSPEEEENSLESGVWSLESGVRSLEEEENSPESGVWSLEEEENSLESGVRSLEEEVISLESGVRSLEEEEISPESVGLTTVEGVEMVQETKQTEALVYIGPTLTGKVQVQRHGIFRSLPPLLKEAADADRELSRLFVPVSDLARARNELTRPTRLARAYRAVAKKYRKVAK